MAKNIAVIVKLQISAGQATPAPPIGPALGQHGINIVEFCKQFNARTQVQSQEGLIIPAVITIYSDKTFTFITKTSPTAILLKRAVGIAKASGEPNRVKVGKLNKNQLREIAKVKLQDLNTKEIESAIKTIEGTAKSMGIEIEGE